MGRGEEWGGGGLLSELLFELSDTRLLRFDEVDAAMDCCGRILYACTDDKWNRLLKIEKVDVLKPQPSKWDEADVVTKVLYNSTVL